MLEATPECFVCTDATPAPCRSACLCTDRYVHDACLEQMLKVSSRTTCPVCLAPYSNVRSTWRAVGVKWESVGVRGCGLVLMALILLACAINTWVQLCCKGRDLSTVGIGVVSGAAALMTVVGLGLLVILARFIVLRGLAILIHSMVLRQLTVRVLATPARTLPAEIAMAEL